MITGINKRVVLLQVYYNTFMIEFEFIVLWSII